MNSINVKIEGFDKLVSQIKQLADQDKKQEVLLILRQIAKPTLDAARSMAPISKRKHVARGKTIEPGSLKKSLGTITGRKSVNPTIYVGPRAKGSFNGWYGHFVHDGVNVYRKGFKRKHSKGGNASGAVSKTKGNPFLTKAYAITNGTVTADAENKMAKFIQRRIDRLS